MSSYNRGTFVILQGYLGGKKNSPKGTVKTYPAKNGQPGQEYCYVLLNVRDGSEEKGNKVDTTYGCELHISELKRINKVRQGSRVTIAGFLVQTPKSGGGTWMNVQGARFYGEIIDDRNLSMESSSEVPDPDPSNGEGAEDMAEMLDI